MQGVPSHMFSLAQSVKKKKGTEGVGGDAAVRYLRLSPTDWQLMKDPAL